MPLIRPSTVHTPFCETSRSSLVKRNEWRPFYPLVFCLTCNLILILWLLSWVSLYFPFLLLVLTFTVQHWRFRLRNPDGTLERDGGRLNSEEIDRNTKCSSINKEVKWLGRSWPWWTKFSLDRRKDFRYKVPISILQLVEERTVLGYHQVTESSPSQGPSLV